MRPSPPTAEQAENDPQIPLINNTRHSCAANFPIERPNWVRKSPLCSAKPLVGNRNIGAAMFTVSRRELRKMRQSQTFADKLMLVGLAGGSLIAFLGLTSVAKAETTSSVIRQLPAEIDQAASLAQMLVAPDTVGLHFGVLSQLPLMALMSIGLATMVLASAAFAATLRTDYSTSNKR